jgi:hypothetical protein
VRGDGKGLGSQVTQPHPRTIAELRRELGASRRLFVVGATDNPVPDLDSCADGTTVIWTEPDVYGITRWYVDFSERGQVSREQPEATFRSEGDACWYGWSRITGTLWKP